MYPFHVAHGLWPCTRVQEYVCSCGSRTRSGVNARGRDSGHPAQVEGASGREDPTTTSSMYQHQRKSKSSRSDMGVLVRDAKFCWVCWVLRRDEDEDEDEERRELSAGKISCRQRNKVKVQGQGQVMVEVKVQGHGSTLLHYRRGRGKPAWAATASHACRVARWGSW